LLPRTKVIAVASKRCLSSSGDSVTVTVSVSTGITASMVFDLFDSDDNHKQQSIGSPSFVITEPGSYYVMVRDQYNCAVYTSPIVIADNCGGLGSGCTGVTPTLTYSWVDCTKVKVTATYSSLTNVTDVTSNASYGGVFVSATPFNPGTLQYAFIYEFEEVGVHGITVWTYYSDCEHQDYATIDFPKFYEPILKYAVTCNGNNNYNVTLYNNSNLFEVTTSNVTFTYSGSGITGTPTGQSYTVNNLAPGTYTYYLTLTTAKKPGDYGYTDQTPNVAMPACTIPVTFTLEPTPDLNFTLAAQYCAEEPIDLVVTNY